jgi:hypothetical protein
MTPKKFEYAPLGNLVKGLEADDGLAIEEVRKQMIARGYDPEGLASRLQAIVVAASKESRLSWMKAGEAVQAKADTAFRKARSWAQRTAAEVEKAFADVVAGHYGTAARMELVSAFRNKGPGDLSTDNKAAFLDSIDLLRELVDGESGAKKQ